MKLFFWRDNKKIDAFASYVADDFYSNVHPDVAREYLNGMSKDQKKTQRKVEQKINEVIGALNQFSREQSLGVYGKARLQRAFNNRLNELGYESDITQRIAEMILLSKVK